jgi:signal transduction histidine kinase
MKNPLHLFQHKKRRLPLRLRLALWSGGLTLILSFFLLFLINASALSSFPTIIRNINPDAYNRILHSPRRHYITLFGILNRPFNPLEGALLQELQSASLMGLGLVTIFSGIGAYWLAGIALRPVRQVREAAQKVSASTLHTRLAWEGPEDEVKELADTFDEMLERLELNFTRQSRFVADVAHELRTPLASLRTSMEVVTSDEEATLADYREMSATQERALTRLECLVSDLLILAKSEQPIVSNAIALTPLIEEVCTDLEHEAACSQVSLRPGNDSELLVDGNGPLLTRVFNNLMANAIYYNRPGGKVEVTIEQKDTWAIVRIIDTGIGIDLEQQPYIFDRFYRVDCSRARHKGGAGLGLSIVSAIVHQHKGSVQVESTPDTGSTFTVLLPLSAETNHFLLT